jgi:hypothetical protein
MGTTTRKSALVVYESMFGNTEQVARAIARGLGESLTVSVLDVGQAPAEPGPDVVHVVAGGPTHGFSMSRSSTRADAINRGAGQGDQYVGLREWIGGLPTRHNGPPLVTFDTRVKSMRHLPGSAAKAAARAARRHGYVSDLDTESFYVDDIDGPLLDGELDRATVWGRDLVALVQTGG